MNESSAGVEPEPPDDPGDVIERLSAAELERCRAVFDQYALAVELLRLRVCERIARGIAQDRWQLGIAGELALALRMSPNRAKGLLARARAAREHAAHPGAAEGGGDLTGGGGGPHL